MRAARYARERNPAENVFIGERLDNLRGGLIELDCELIKESLVKHLRSVYRVQLIGQPASIFVVERGHTLQAFITEKAHMDSESQTTKPAIGANIGRRFLAANMLLAR